MLRVLFLQPHSSVVQAKCFVLDPTAAGLQGGDVVHVTSGDPGLQCYGAKVTCGVPLSSVLWRKSYMWCSYVSGVVVHVTCGVLLSSVLWRTLHVVFLCLQHCGARYMWCSYVSSVVVHVTCGVPMSPVLWCTLHVVFLCLQCCDALYMWCSSVSSVVTHFTCGVPLFPVL